MGIFDDYRDGLVPPPSAEPEEDDKPRLQAMMYDVDQHRHQRTWGINMDAAQPQEIIIRAPSIRLEGNVTVDGDLHISGSLDVDNNLIVGGELRSVETALVAEDDN